MENDNVQKNINDLIKEIDEKIDEVKSNPSYNEEEGIEQVQKMYDYIKNHLQATEDILKTLKEKIEEK